MCHYVLEDIRCAGKTRYIFSWFVSASTLHKVVIQPVNLVRLASQVNRAYSIPDATAASDAIARPNTVSVPARLRAGTGDSLTLQLRLRLQSPLRMRRPLGRIGQSRRAQPSPRGRQVSAGTDAKFEIPC